MSNSHRRPILGQLEDNKKERYQNFEILILPQTCIKGKKLPLFVPQSVATTIFNLFEKLHPRCYTIVYNQNFWRGAGVVDRVGVAVKEA